VRLFAVPAAVLAIFPYYRDYRYVVEEDTICIVDPDTYEIVDVLDDGTYAPSSRPQVAEITLTVRERTLVLDSIPPDFPQVWLRLRLALGAEIPANIELYEFAPLLLDQVPKLRDFRFVVSQDQVVIVTPLDRSICACPRQVALIPARKKADGWQVIRGREFNSNLPHPLQLPFHQPIHRTTSPAKTRERSSDLVCVPGEPPPQGSASQSTASSTVGSCMS
jgi:hypothetical protein